MTIEEQRAAVMTEATSWLNTPFRDAACIKGAHGGIDCGQFLYAVYNAAGVADIGERRTNYNLQFMLNTIEDDYLKELLKYADELHPKEPQLAAREAQPGDVVILFWGKSYSHGAILLAPWPGRIIHALNGLGVVFNDAYRDARIIASLRKYRNHPPRFFRPKKWGWKRRVSP